MPSAFLRSAGIVPDSRVGDLRVFLLHQALPYALGRVALLVPVLGVLFQLGDDERAVLVHDARRLAPGGRLRREIGGSSRYLYTVSWKTSNVLLISEALCPLMRICLIECTLGMLIICLSSLSCRYQSKTRIDIGYGRHVRCQSVEFLHANCRELLCHIHMPRSRSMPAWERPIRSSPPPWTR